MEFARPEKMLYTNIGQGGHIDELLDNAGLEHLKDAGKIILKVNAATWNRLKIEYLWHSSGSPPRFAWVS